MHQVKKAICQFGCIFFVYCVCVGQSVAIENNTATVAVPAAKTVITTTENKFSQTEVEKFVADAKAFILANGKEAAFKAFMDPKNTQFRKGTLYVFAFDFNGVCLAHIKTAMVGSNMLELKDQNGVPLTRDLLNAAKNNPNGGWAEYMWQNPETKQIEKKLSFVLKVDDNLWIGTGLYNSETK